MWQAQVSVANVPDRDRMEMTIEPSFVELNLEEIPLEKAPAVLTVEDLPKVGEKSDVARPSTALNAEPKTADSKPTEQNPEEAKPDVARSSTALDAEPKPAEQKLDVTRTSTALKAEQQPVESKPVEAKNAGDKAP